MKDWTETTISDLSEVNELLKWLYGNETISDVKKKVEELEERIEKLEQQMEENEGKEYRIDRVGKIYNAYDLSKRPDLRKKGRKRWRI